MNILVTGGAGFIGSHVQDKLIAAGHRVGVIDNLRSGKKEHLHPQATFFQADIRNKEEMAEIFVKTQPQAIFHLAAQNEVPYSMFHPLEDEEINIRGMMNILELANQHRTKVIYSNTGGAFYGDVPVEHLPVGEDEPVLKPTSFYGVSKGSAEAYLKLYGNIYQLPWVSLRYANVYGPRQDGNRETGVVAIFCEKLLAGQTPTINGDGSHTRDYIYVDDVVAANLLALNYRPNDYFNIATGIKTSNLTVFNTIAKALKAEIKPNFGPPRPGDALHNVLSPAKAKKLLKWQPQIDLATGIKLTLDYYTSKSKKQKTL